MLKTITINDLAKFSKNYFPSKQTQELIYFLLIFLSQFEDGILGGTEIKVSTAWRTFKFWATRPGEVVRALKCIPDKLDRIKIKSKVIKRVKNYLFRLCTSELEGFTKTIHRVLDMAVKYYEIINAKEVESKLARPKSVAGIRR